MPAHAHGRRNRAIVYIARALVLVACVILLACKSDCERAAENLCEIHLHKPTLASPFGKKVMDNCVFEQTFKCKSGGR